MMLMITIDTKNRKPSRMKIAKSKIHPLKGWRPYANSSTRKVSIFERLGLWRKTAKRRKHIEQQSAIF
ncbi:MAG: hypothetical protein WC269_00620 [Candidatus Gracilibacteria bacterium]